MGHAKKSIFKMRPRQIKRLSMSKKKTVKDKATRKKITDYRAEKNRY